MQATGPGGRSDAGKGKRVLELFLMRHADAEPSEGDDFARRLTERGCKQAQKMGAWLAAMRLEDMVLAASPYLRARETAEIVAGMLGKGVKVQLDERLASGMGVTTGSEVVHELGSAGKRLCLVGHAPDLDLLAAYCIGAREGALALKKGAVAALDTVRPGNGGSQLKWLITPKL